MDNKDALIESVTGDVGVMKRIRGEVSEAKKELKKATTKVEKNKIETRIKALEESKKDIIKVLNEATFKSVREELGVKKVTEKNAEKVAEAVLNLYSDEVYFDQETGARNDCHDTCSQGCQHSQTRNSRPTAKPISCTDGTG